jgi:hypothetical protein
LFVRVLGGREGTEAIVPLGFERIRDQAILRIDPQEASLREIGFIASAFDLLLPNAISLSGTRRELLLDGQRDVHRERRHRLDEHVADRVIEGATVNRLTHAVRIPAKMNARSGDRERRFRASRTLIGAKRRWQVVS